MQSDTSRVNATLTPLFRWPGGKRWLVPSLRQLLPLTYSSYYEPFFGGGALFFAEQPSNAVLSDVNDELMACYRAVRDTPGEVEACLQKLPRDKDSYYHVRSTAPDDPVERAARLIYLTTLAFNGIYRVNRQGVFNVPYGGREYVNLGAAGSLSSYSRALGSAKIRSGDFEESLQSAGKGDVVFLDPPYTVTHSNNGFLRYNESIFSMQDQRRLADAAEALASRGAHVIVTNAQHSSVSDLYSDVFRRIAVRRTSRMAADPARRLAVEELVLTNVR